MAKKSMIAREEKRARTVAKYAAKRAQLKETINNFTAPLTRSVGKRKSSCRSCRAMPAPCVSSVVVR